MPIRDSLISPTQFDCVDPRDNRIILRFQFLDVNSFIFIVRLENICVSKTVSENILIISRIIRALTTPSNFNIDQIPRLIVS